MQHDAVNIFLKLILSVTAVRRTLHLKKKKVGEKKTSLLLALLNNANKSFYSEAQWKSLP